MSAMKKNIKRTNKNYEAMIRSFLRVIVLAGFCICQLRAFFGGKDFNEAHYGSAYIVHTLLWNLLPLCALIVSYIINFIKRTPKNLLLDCIVLFYVTLSGILYIGNCMFPPKHDFSSFYGVIIVIQIISTVLLFSIGFSKLMKISKKKKAPQTQLAQKSLCGVNGIYKDLSIPITENTSIIIGRDSLLSNLVIEDYSLSRKHCEIKYDAKCGKYIVVDYSVSGTYLSGKRLYPNRIEYADTGDVLTLANGNNEFIFK